MKQRKVKSKKGQHLTRINISYQLEAVNKIQGHGIHYWVDHEQTQARITFHTHTPTLAHTPGRTTLVASLQQDNRSGNLDTIGRGSRLTVPLKIKEIHDLERVFSLAPENHMQSCAPSLPSNDMKP